MKKQKFDFIHHLCLPFVQWESQPKTNAMRKAEKEVIKRTMVTIFSWILTGQGFQAVLSAILYHDCHEIP
jgi:hypothetical protein